MFFLEVRQLTVCMMHARTNYPRVDSDTIVEKRGRATEIFISMAPYLGLTASQKQPDTSGAESVAMDTQR